MNFNIRNKLLLIIAPFLLSFLLAIFIIVHLQKSEVEKLNAASVTEKSRAFDSLLVLDSYDLITLIYEEYGFWIDLADYIRKPDPEFAKYNIDFLLSAYGFDALWVMDSSFNIIHNNYLNNSFSDLPEIRSQEYLNRLKKKKGLNSYGYHNGRLVHIISTTVHKSYEDFENGISDGLLITARELDENKLNLLESALNAEIDVIDSRRSAEYSEETIKFFYNWMSEPVGAAVIKFDKDLVQNVFNSSDIILYLFLGFGLLITVVFFILVTRIISKPLDKITHALNTESDNVLGEITKREDEFGKISRVISEFFGQKKILLEQIAEKEAAQIELKGMYTNLEKLVIERSKEIKSVLEQSPLAIGIFNAGGSLLNCNANFRKKLLSDEEKLNLNGLLDLLELDSDKIREDFRNLIRRGTYFTIEKHGIKGNKTGYTLHNKEAWVRIQFYAIEDGSGNITRFVIAVEEKTEYENALRINQRFLEQKKISESVLVAQEEERRRISKDIHDSIGQMLMTAHLFVENHLKEHKGNNEDIMRVNDILASINTEIRNVINDLHPIDLERFGLVKAVDVMCKNFSKFSDVAVDFKSYDIPDNLNLSYQINIYRIIQEILKNVREHSEAGEVTIELFYRDDNLYLNAEDNGKGFEYKKEDILLKKGRGLKNIINRGEFFGGIVDISSSVGNGTSISIKVPVNE
ncbi:MAG: hypothetical protein JW995_11875 [Melioribacteraceae bacterium]|nr:hypothetical protein [Melioribacteraceae bacterium]